MQFSISGFMIHMRDRAASPLLCHSFTQMDKLRKERDNLLQKQLRTGESGSESHSRDDAEAAADELNKIREECATKTQVRASVVLHCLQRPVVEQDLLFVRL